jgi:hypothetical protein
LQQSALQQSALWCRIMSCGSSAPISSCHVAPVWHVMQLQYRIVVVSIAVVSVAVVSIAAVSIAEMHHDMRLHCWVGLKRTFSFPYFREKFLLASRTQMCKNFCEEKFFHKNENFC